MSTDIIKLNVGGTRMETLKSTLTQLPFFESLLTRWFASKTVNQTELFVDYDPVLFRELLNKLRNSQHKFPLMSGIDAMCQYFGYVEPDNYRIVCSSMKGKNETDTEHSYQINTQTDKLFKIFVHRDKIDDVQLFLVELDDKQCILEIGTLGFSYFFKEIKPSIWILKQIYLNRLQNYEMIKIIIRFNKTNKETRSGVYIKKLIDAKTKTSNN